MNLAGTLTAEELEIYSWQLPVEGFGEAGQLKLKNASVLISRVGGLGGVVALELAAAGVGRLLLAHAGNLQPADLNRQILMGQDEVGQPRIEAAVKRLRQLNPRIEIVSVPENLSANNVEQFVQQVDLAVGCAPRFEERFALNHAVIRHRKPMVHAAVYDLEAHLTTVVPGRSPCLRCLCPEAPATWTRRFPVFGAVPAAAGAIAAMEVIKVIAGFGEPLIGRMLVFNLRDMTWRTLKLTRDPHCPECRSLTAGG